MAIGTSVNSKPADVFKTFPEFSKLTLADRAKYEKLIRDLPPYSDYSFPTLMNWWNSLDACAVSILNDNLVISYWIPGMESMSGLSLVGTNKVDESLCYVLDHLKAKGEEARLVHVPEFVISHIAHPELFHYKPERDNDEYVLAVDKYYPIKHSVSFRRYRIRKFMKQVEGLQVTVKQLDLSLAEDRQFLLENTKHWPRKGTVNHIFQHLEDGMRIAIDNAEHIGTENICLFVNDELHGFILYSRSTDKRYIIFSHLMVNYKIRYCYDYAIYAFAEWLSAHGVQYVNIDSDAGVQLLRMLKLTLGPHNFFRKYTITPAD